MSKCCRWSDPRNLIPAKFNPLKVATCATPVSDTIKKNNLSIFSNSTPKKTTKIHQKLQSVKANVGIFSRLFIACQTRNGDLIKYFHAHENQAAPPSLSENGLLRLSKKTPKIQIQAVYINMLIPATGKRFRDYAIHTLVNRVDIVWYRRKFTSNGIIPGKWATFLQCSENKAELFPFLSNMVVLEMSHKLVVSTNNDEVASNEEIDFTTLIPSNIEEADGRMMLL